MRFLSLGSVALLLTLLSPVPEVRAQGAASTLQVKDFLDLETVGNPQISPDGKTIVYTRGFVDKVNDHWDGAIWVMNADGTRNRFLTKGSGAIWSPDGTRIAYINTSDDPKGAQIFVRYMDAEGSTTQITRLTESPANISWSPDGKWISFASFVPKRTDWQIDLPAPPPNAKWTPAPRIADRLHYRADRRGYTDPGFTHLFVVSADGGSPRQLTHGDWNVGAAFDGLVIGGAHSWTPDGKTILFDGFADSTTDKNFRVTNIYSVDVASGVMKTLTTTKGSWLSPKVSPDGKLVAFAGRELLPVVWQTADLYVMNIDGSGARDLTRSVDREMGTFGGASAIWAPDGSGLYVSPQDRGTSNILFVPLTGAPRPVTTGTHLLSLTSVSKAGDLVGTSTSFQKPGDVVRVAVDKRGAAQITQLTQVNDDLLQGKTLATAEEIWYPSSGGAKIQGWIVKPPNFDASKKYPLLLEIHGGPQGMYSVGFDMMWQVFASSGFVVLYLNPRGSTGYGDAFVRSIEKSYPGPDYDDLMAGVDTVLGRGYVDSKQLYVSGCSGGGALSSWVIGHTTRFAAAAVRCPVSDWIGMAGNADVPYFAYAFFDKPFWEDPMAWFKQSSLAYVGNVTTPTILMTGVLDMRTPMPQSEAFYAALQVRGVPSRLIRFENEWHGTESIPSNWMRTMLYMMSWFKQYSRPSM
ncbi:MAG TPA: S9 family peptidase [Gemmatimonadaceae bacterium]|nr:S9 family peptidase [Gemmatimonadaceae bacterium]